MANILPKPQYLKQCHSAYLESILFPTPTSLTNSSVTTPGGGGGGGGGGVLPMWWVIHMCRGFDPLFSLWQDRARSFWGIFLIHQQQSYLLGYKNYQFLQKSIFLAPNSIFSSIFLGPIFSGQRHTPISFQAEYPPPPPGSLPTSTWVVLAKWILSSKC